MENKNKLLYLLIGLLVLFLLIFVFDKIKVFNFLKSTPEINHHVIVGQIEELGNLEVAKYNIQDVMQYKKTRTFLPNPEVSLLIKGEVIACINLTNIKEEDIYTDKDSISIILPLPQICHEKLDHSQSKVYNVKYGLWETTDLIDESYKEAERHLHKTALNMGIETESKTNAEKVVTQLLKGVGFKKVNITFANTKFNSPAKH